MSETIEQKCIAKGVKLTDQRRIIAKVMSDSQDHPDVNELFLRISKLFKFPSLIIFPFLSKIILLTSGIIVSILLVV